MNSWNPRGNTFAHIIPKLEKNAILQLIPTQVIGKKGISLCTDSNW